MSAAVGTLPRVVIVGRPNVGKSSLFNRVVGERRAIVEEEAGTTRDRVEADVEWLDRRFRLIDTGGFETALENVYAAQIVEQIRTAMASAALIILCLDAKDGLTTSDYDIIDVIRRAAVPVIVVATKADNERREATGIADASGLGLGEALPVSALHDINVGLMLDEVVRRLPESGATVESNRVRIAIIGRPNVGKSALLNAILGEQRVIVSEVPGTTRDAIDSDVETPEGAFTLIDTAGVRKPGKLGQGVELHSVMRTRTAVERCDVAVLVVDGTEGVTAQDAHIAGLAIEASKGLIVAVNKIDLWEDAAERREWADRQMRGRLQFVPWAMVTFISALEAKGLGRLLELATQAMESRRRRVPTAELNAQLTRAIRDHVPPLIRNRRFKLLYATQTDIEPPTFVLFVNDPALLHFSYRRYLERTIREAWDFEGTSIRLVFRARSGDDARP
jgi:GTP-binding protein